MNPTFIYGTAWKEENTAPLVLAALREGFRTIDTANQRKHYNEEGVGKALEQFCEEGGNRQEIFLQTKFTFARGQDHRKPYDENASFAVQVKQSFESSLEHLKQNSIDSLLLHGPYKGEGISAADLEVWAAMEELYAQKKVKYLGISNMSAAQLKEFYGRVQIKPKFAQIRTYASRGWERETRNFCQENEIIFQGFSLLTANRKELEEPKILEIAQKYKKTIPQVVFSFCKSMGILPITGTSSVSHMKEDLSSFDFLLNEDEIKTIESLGLDQ